MYYLTLRDGRVQTPSTPSATESLKPLAAEVRLENRGSARLGMTGLATLAAPQWRECRIGEEMLRQQ